VFHNSNGPDLSDVEPHLTTRTNQTGHCILHPADLNPPSNQVTKRHPKKPPKSLKIIPCENIPPIGPLYSSPNSSRHDAESHIVKSHYSGAIGGEVGRGEERRGEDTRGGERGRKRHHLIIQTRETPPRHECSGEKRGWAYWRRDFERQRHRRLACMRRRSNTFFVRSHRIRIIIGPQRSGMQDVGCRGLVCIMLTFLFLTRGPAVKPLGLKGSILSR
jgi:hypothetical protein